MFSWVLPALLVLFTQQQWAIAKQTPLQPKKKKNPDTQQQTANHEEDERGKGGENKKRTWNEDLWAHQVYCQHQLMSKSKSVFFFNQDGESWRVGVFFLPFAFCNIFFYKLKISGFCNLFFNKSTIWRWDFMSHQCKNESFFFLMRNRLL